MPSPWEHHAQPGVADGLWLTPHLAGTDRMINRFSFVTDKMQEFIVTLDFATRDNLNATISFEGPGRENPARQPDTAQQVLDVFRVSEVSSMDIRCGNGSALCRRISPRLLGRKLHTCRE